VSSDSAWREALLWKGEETKVLPLRKSSAVHARCSGAGKRRQTERHTSPVALWPGLGPVCIVARDVELGAVGAKGDHLQGQAVGGGESQQT
jgi:hypothetical protein